MRSSHAKSQRGSTRLTILLLLTSCYSYLPSCNLVEPCCYLAMIIIHCHAAGAPGAPPGAPSGAGAPGAGAPSAGVVLVGVVVMSNDDELLREEELAA